MFAKATSDFTSYSSLAGGLLEQVKTNNMELIEEVLNTAVEVFNTPEQGMRKYLILRFMKDAIVNKSAKFINKFVGNRSVLNLLGTYCMHRAGEKAEDRGKDLFPSDPQSGIMFLRLALQLVQSLATTYPIDAKKNPTKFKIQYDELVLNKVQFPANQDLIKPFDPTEQPQPMSNIKSAIAYPDLPPIKQSLAQLEQPMKSQVQQNRNKERDDVMLKLNEIKQSIYQDIDMLNDTLQESQPDMEYVNDVLETYARSLKEVEKKFERQIEKATEFDGVFNEEEFNEVVTLKQFTQEYPKFYEAYFQTGCTLEAFYIIRKKTLDRITQIHSKDFGYQVTPQPQEYQPEKGKSQIQKQQQDDQRRAEQLKQEQQRQEQQRLEQQRFEQAKIEAQQREQQLKEQQRQEQIKQQKIQEQQRQEQIRQEQLREQQRLQQQQQETQKSEMHREQQRQDQMRIEKRLKQEAEEKRLIEEYRQQELREQQQQAYAAQQSKNQNQYFNQDYSNQNNYQSYNNQFAYQTPTQQPERSQLTRGAVNRLSEGFKFNEEFDDLSQSTQTMARFPLRQNERIPIKQHTGQLVAYQSDQFDSLDRLGLTESQKKRFKIATLQGKAALINSREIQIGVTTSLQFVPLNSKNYLKITIFFGNKTNYPIQKVKIHFEGDNNSFQMWVSGQISEVKAGEQQKQEIICIYKTHQFRLIDLVFQGMNNNQQLKTVCFLPTTLVSFMDFKQINVQIFRTKWRAKKMDIIKSESFLLNPKIVKTGNYLKKIFPLLCELSSFQTFQDQMIDFVQDPRYQKYYSYKLGGLFELSNVNSNIMIKFIVHPNMQCTIQIITSLHDRPIGCQLLHTLEFLIGLP